MPTMLVRLRRTFLAAALGSLSLPALAASFSVNDAGDAPDANPGNGTCATAGGVCTLRAAIQEVNALAMTAPHRITFDSSVSTVTLTSNLPVVAVPVEIDGNRVSVDPMNPRVDINFNGLTNGFQFNDSASQAFDPSPLPNAPRSGLFNLVVRNANGDGISLSGRGFTVQNCYVGMMPNGETASPNQGHGISISSPAPMTALPELPPLGDLDLSDIDAVIAFLFTALAAVNAPTTIDGNLISGNGLDGVRIFGEHTAMVFVRGNRIGTSADGDLAVPNASVGQGQGVQLVSNAFANFIGPFNLISGNKRPNSAANGIFVNTGTVRFPNFIAGNLIGPGGTVDPLNFDPFNPNIDDLLDFGNLENGIRLDTRRATSSPANPTPYSVIIGPANLISFNGTDTPALDNLNADPAAGIFITGNSEDAYVLGNVIGGLRLDVMGNPILIGGNKGDGIQITTSNHLIGGPSLAERNTISGNGRHGITVRGSSTRNVSVQGNLIGRDLLNLLDFGQGGDGIHVNAASVLTIGGSADGAGNVIAASARNGIKLTGGGINQGWANLISRNSLFGNATGGSGIGIDLEQANNAPDPVDGLPVVPTSWANNGQNTAIICSGQMGAPAACGAAAGPTFDTGSNQIAMTAVLNSRPDTEYVVELFLVDAPGNLGNGEGRRFVASQNVTTDAAGLALIPASVSAPPGGASGSLLTLTVTDVRPTTRPDGSMGPANNTSEFSAAVAVATPGTLAFSPDTLPFGSVNVGASADLQTTLSHVSGDAVSGITLGTTGSGFSIQASTCGMPPFTLGPSQSCMVTVRFMPAAAGAAMGTLTASAPIGTGDSVALTGTGEDPGSLVFSDASLDLGSVVIGANSTATTTLSNPGSAAVSNVTLQVTGPGFSRDGGTCSNSTFVLNGGASCTVTLRFQPAAAGAAMGSLSASGDGGTGDSVALSGSGIAPANLALDLADYDFGTVIVGASSDRTATLSNDGGVDAANVLLGLTGSGFSRTGGSCGMGAFTLAAASSCTIELRFEPASTGMASGSLTATGDGGLSAASSLSGSAIAAGALEFDPAALAFGDLPAGASASLSTLLRNTGGAAITDISLAVTGTGFARDGGTCSTMAFSLAAGEECSVSVSFSPAAGGAANGSLVANSPDGGASAALSGNGLAPAALAFDSPSYAFGNVVVGAFEERTATLSNSGDQSADNVQVIASGSGFSRVGGSCAMGAFNLAGGASCTVVLRFAPMAAGAASGSVAASGDGGLAAAADLTGTGLAAGALAWDPATLAFGDLAVGASATLSTTLANTGGTSIDGITLAVTGTGFARDGGDCPSMAFNLAAGASCSVIVRFQPAAAGAAMGSLSANAADANASASLSGNGLAAASLDWDMASYDFGSVAVGAFSERTAVLANSGGAAATNVSVIASGAGFSRTGGSCAMGAFSLAGGASCSVVLRFAPTATGAASGSVAASADGGLAASASLSGNGLAAGALAFTPMSLAFGDVVVGSSATLSTTLGNSGGVAVDDITLGLTGSGFSRDGGSCPLASFSLAAGADCTVIVRFMPAAAGAANGNLLASAAAGSASASLSGNGSAPGAGAVGFMPLAGLAFGSVELGSLSTLSIGISNTGSQALEAMAVTVEGPFSIVSNSCPATLASDASCSVAIRFAPAVLGAAQGLVRVTADGGIDATAPLSGTGIAAAAPPPVMIPSLDRDGLLLLLLLFTAIAWRAMAGGARSD